MQKGFFIRRTCRICGSPKFLPVLTLGSMPPANAFLKKADFARERSFPLTLVFCPRCTLAQLREVVDPKILFAHYTYLTNASAPLVAHFTHYAKEVIRRYPLSKKDLVVEIGSNDGTLLLQFKKSARVVGVDPAKNVAAIARKKGIPTEVAFFTVTRARRLKKKYGSATVVLANNVFAHIDDIHEVLRGVGELLGERGVYIFETHWVGNLLGKGGFDQIYHEHLSYFSLHALSYLAGLHGMRVVDVELVHMHGESLRVYIQKQGTPKVSVAQFLAREKKLGLGRIGGYRSFAKKVERNKKELTTLLHKLKTQGKSIVGYGAPAKGNTLLNYIRIDGRVLDFVTDTTSLKQGLFTPGTHIPVVPPERLYTHPPHYALLLSWNYASAILAKEKKLRTEGVKFIIPVPKVKVI